MSDFVCNLLSPSHSFYGRLNWINSCTAMLRISSPFGSHIVTQKTRHSVIVAIVFNKIKHNQFINLQIYAEVVGQSSRDIQVDTKQKCVCLCYLYDELGVFLLSGLCIHPHCIYLNRNEQVEEKMGKKHFNFTVGSRERQAEFAAGKRGPCGILSCRLWPTMQECFHLLQQHMVDP